MALSHQDLLKCCILILDGFDDEVYAVENHVEEFFNAYPELDECEQTFIKEVFAGCVRYKSVVNVVLSGFYNSDGKTALRSDETLYRVVAYLFLFRVEELGMKEVLKYVKYQNVHKMYKFLNFLLNGKNIQTWMKDEWNKLYDSEFVQSSILQPLLKIIPELQKVLHSMKMIIDNGTHFQKHSISNTEPEPFDLTQVKLKKVPMPQQIPLVGKPKPIPNTTYECSKDQEILDQLKEKHQKASQNRYKWMQRNATSVMSAGKSPQTLQRMQQVADDENRKLCFEGCINPPPPPAFDETVPVRLNAATILREERMYKLQEEQLMKRIARLEAGEGDEWEFVEWQGRMRKLDRARELEEFERRRLSGLLSQEQSVIARQQLVQQKKDQVAEMKTEACRLMNEYMRRRLLEEKKLKKLIEKVSCSRDSARYAKQQMQSYKAHVVQLMNEEYQEMMRQALEEAEAEMQQKIDLINQIRTMRAVSSSQQPKVIDFTSTSGYGFLCEMSIAELRERLRLMQIEQEEWRIAKREQINNDKQATAQMLLDKLDTIAKHRNEIVRAAAIRSEERRKARAEKIKPTPPRNETLTKMEQLLEQRKAERRRLEAELKIGQEGGAISQQKVTQLDADDTTLDEKSRRKQAEMCVRNPGKLSNTEHRLAASSSAAAASAGSRAALLAI